MLYPDENSHSMHSQRDFHRGCHLVFIFKHTDDQQRAFFYPASQRSRRIYKFYISRLKHGDFTPKLLDINMSSSLTHAQRVLRLYKKSARNLQSWITDRPTFRYEVTLLRARFDEHKNETDMKKAVRLLQDGEEELWQKQHPQPYIFIDSPGGTRYERNIPAPEWVLNYWHPSEKARYPTYFARREKRVLVEQTRWEELVEEEKQLLGQGANQDKPQAS